ncbi:MAG: hypothetical protein DSY70_01120 [Desulfobulbus sp.]|nr:MAG: hypothetical protein DSY70_01120 [Desulfobulbus sp.]
MRIFARNQSRLVKFFEHNAEIGRKNIFRNSSEPPFFHFLIPFFIAEEKVVCCKKTCVSNIEHHQDAKF